MSFFDFVSPTLGSLTELAGNKSQTLSSDELIKSINEKIYELKSNGVFKSKVLLKLENSFTFFIYFFALWELDCLIVPSHPNIPISLEESLIECYNIGFVISEQDPIAKHAIQPSETKPGLLLLTSGTTGVPKGVLHTEKSILARIKSLRGTIPLEEVSRTLCILPTSFGHGLIGNCLFPLLSGAHLFVVKQTGLDAIYNLKDILITHEITFFSSTPSLWNLLFSKLDFHIPDHFVKRIHCASAPLDKRTFRKIRESFGHSAHVYNIFGMTELASWAAFNLCEDSFESNTIGQLIEGQFEIRDHLNQPLSCGETGQLHIKSECLAGGIYENKQFIEFSCNDWFATGDLCKFLTSKRLVWVARMGNQINRGGIKVYPEEVESLLMDNPHLESSCCFSIQDPIFGQNIAIAIVLKNGHSLQNAKAWTRRTLSPHKKPSKWYVLTEIPRNARGKIDRIQVRKLALGLVNS